MRGGTINKAITHTRAILAVTAALALGGLALADSPADQVSQDGSGAYFSSSASPYMVQVKGGYGGKKNKAANNPPPTPPPADPPAPTPTPTPTPPAATPPADPPATQSDAPIPPDTSYPYEVDLNDGRIVMCDLEDDGDFYNLIKKGGTIRVAKTAVKVIIHQGMTVATTEPATQPDAAP